MIKDFSAMDASGAETFAREISPAETEAAAASGGPALKPRQPTLAEIAVLARQLYRDTNCEEGHDLENWLCAERTLIQKYQVQRELEKISQRGCFEMERASGNLI